MKLLVVTFIREHQQAVIALVQKAGVKIFSLTETSGIKQKEEQAVTENWFGYFNYFLRTCFFYKTE